MGALMLNFFGTQQLQWGSAIIILMETGSCEGFRGDARRRARDVITKWHKTKVIHRLGSERAEQLCLAF